MIRFINKPNLPTGDVTTVAISEDAAQAIYKLNSLGINTIKIKKSSLLPQPVASHTDLQLLHVKNDILFSTIEHLCIGESELNFKQIYLKGIIGNKYPSDVPLNCTFLGKKLICNTNTIAKEVLQYAEKEQIQIIHVNQGYTRCSIAVINENAIITDDLSIFTATQNFLNDVLLISKGSIELKGYNYGFIGGCCGKISQNKIAFNGRIESHSNAKEIIDFTNKHNVEICELHSNKLIDIGGIIPLIEKHTLEP